MYGVIASIDHKVEKYGPQIIRMTQNDTLNSIQRMDSLQKDAALNWNLSNKFDVDFKTDLPEKK